jgi:antagonist of KipI
LGIPAFKIIKPGLFTTIQKPTEQRDMRRSASTPGAFDRFALKIGNLILKNPIGVPGIEMVGEGLEIQTMKETAIAVTGGSFDVKLNGNQIEQWCAVKVSNGDTVSIGTSRSGWRCYICVLGGVKELHLPRSRSGSGRGNLSELYGHPLKRGDVLVTDAPRIPWSELTGRGVKETLLPKLDGERELRIILRPQYDLLKDGSKEVFLNSSYRVSAESNRVGYRFEGPHLLFKDEERRDIGLDRSDPLNDEDAGGMIHVMEDGEVVCTGPDFAPTPGFIEIARLITPDMDRVAQLRPKDHIRFKVITREDARLIFHYSLGLINETNIVTTLGLTSST